MAGSGAHISLHTILRDQHYPHPAFRHCPARQLASISSSPHFRPIPRQTIPSQQSYGAISTRATGSHVLPQDSATHAVAVVHVTRTPSGLNVELIDGRTQRTYRSQAFPLPALDSPIPASLNSDATIKATRRWAVHGIADAVLSWITGDTGIAQSRIAYVSRGDVHVIDADGADDHLFHNAGIALSPAWSHDGHTLVYSDLTQTGTHLIELQLDHGTTAPVRVASGGLNITPIYSPDDQWIIFAHGDEDGTTLVALRRGSTIPPQTILRRHGFDNSSPVFRPDGKRLAFVSARPKTPQIYSVDPDGHPRAPRKPPLTPTVRSYRARRP